jgi:hypothetical protein
MRTKMRDLGTLRATVEAVRARSYAEVPAGLVDEVLTIEASSHEDRLLARERVSAALNAHLTATDAS